VGDALAKRELLHFEQDAVEINGMVGTGNVKKEYDAAKGTDQGRPFSKTTS